ncbi:MAG: tripartite tricarboxylate transporter substrate binding protein [Proteobacteria bacterium]|nr:tripartite tricarboxylate transporter substrate binding protein [Pseudomonadota bacterium]
MALRALGCATVAALLAPRAGPARAADEPWPARPIRVVVPNPPGGSIDGVLRGIGPRVARDLGQPIVIDNRGGASGAIGAALVKDSAPDGYTLLAASTSTNVLTPRVIPNAQYDGVADFVPIVNLAYTMKMVVVNPALPVHTLGEFIAYARARPGQIDYASTGKGSSSQIDAEMFCERAGIRLREIPYRGPSQATLALVAGEVQVSFNSVTAGIGAVRGGQVRPLAVIAKARTPLLPDVPTVAEAGLPDLEIRTWIGLVAPKGTPPAVVATLNRAFNAALADPATLAWMADQAWEPIGGSPESFARTLADDDARFAAEIRKLGLRD